MASRSSLTLLLAICVLLLAIHCQADAVRNLLQQGTDANIIAATATTYGKPSTTTTKSSFDATKKGEPDCHEEKKEHKHEHKHGDDCHDHNQGAGISGLPDMSVEAGNDYSTTESSTLNSGPKNK